VAMRMIGFVQGDCMETWLLAIFLCFKVFYIYKYIKIIFFFYFLKIIFDINVSK